MKLTLVSQSGRLFKKFTLYILCFCVQFDMMCTLGDVLPFEYVPAIEY